MGDARSFLSAILPSSGYYLVASYNQKNPKQNEEHVVESIDEMLAIAADIDNRGKDAFFALGTLDKQAVPIKKINKQTGEEYTSVERRTKANIKYISVLFIEIDVEPTGMKKNKACYKTQGEALAEVLLFSKATKLRKPTVVNSGGGLHVYWTIEGDIEPEAQNHLATKLRMLVVDQMPLVADVGVMTDYARVLRVPDTHNYKQEVPRPVVCLNVGKDTSYLDLDEALTARMDELNLRIQNRTQNSLPDYMQGVEANIPAKLETIPPLRFEKVLATCQQIKWAYENQNDVSEPQWVNSIRVLQKCEDYRNVIHRFSEKYDTDKGQYSFDETERKIDHITSKYDSPVKCEQFEKDRPGGCAGCPHALRQSSPAWLARDVAEAKPPQMEVTVNQDGAEVVQTIEIPNPPSPYLRTADGRIVMMSKGRDGEVDEVFISQYDMYPTVRKAHTSGEAKEVTTWKIHIPHEGWRDVDIPSTTLQDTKALSLLLAGNAMYLLPSQISGVQYYMLAYMNHLQKKHKAEVAYTKLGWHDGFKTFVLNEHIFTAEGRSTHRGKNAVIVEGIKQKGDFQTWNDTMNSFLASESPERRIGTYITIASPLMALTGLGACTVNLNGPSGTGKTSTMMAALSFWGVPHSHERDGEPLLMISGSRNGFTVPGLYQMLDKHNHIAAYLDETTTQDPRATAELAYDLTNGKGKIKKIGEQEQWHCPVILSQNGSILDRISSNNANCDGQLARILEIPFSFSKVHTKAEADKFLSVISENYGVACFQYVEFCVQNVDKIKALIEKYKAEVDALTGASSTERFKTGLITTIRVSMAILRKLGMLKDWPMEDDYKWMLQLIKTDREVIESHIATATDILSDYINDIVDQTLIIEGVGNSKHMNAGRVVRAPNRALVARHDLDVQVMWTSRRNVQKYCELIRADFTAIERDLLKSKVLLDTRAQKALGANTELDRAVSRCWMIDLTHPSISDKNDLVRLAVNQNRQLAAA